MGMKDRDLDEFGSLFERAVIPAIEVSRVEIPDIVVLADFSDRTPSCAALAAELAARFGSRVSARFLLRYADEEHLAEAERILQRIEAAERRVIAGDPLEHLMEIAEEERPSLIVAPGGLRGHGAGDDGTSGRFVEALLVSTDTPVLLVRAPLEGSTFDRILAKVPGGRTEMIAEFSFAFALCRPGGLIRLLHVIEEERLQELAELLEVTPEIDTETGAKDLRAAIETRMDHLLKGAVRTADAASFSVEAAIRVGDPVEIVPDEARGMSLLIVASDGSRGEFLESRAFRVMQCIPDMPVLAL